MGNYQELSLLLFVTGSHLLPEFGYTIRNIEQDGFPIAARVDVSLSSHSPTHIARAMGEVTARFAEVYNRFRPDIVLVLGDRYEMHAAAVAAVPFRIPIAHIHGGEVTEGALDEIFRHSLTKMSHLHFVATETYGRRIVAMGEEPWRVIVSGAPSLDNLYTTPLLSPEELKTKLDLDLTHPIVLITFHPTTLESEDTEQHVKNLLSALKCFPNLSLIFTAPNADLGGHIIRRAIKNFVNSHPRSRFCVNLGTAGYFTLMSIACAMVGNSSSGIIEAASFQLPVVNIGNRQKGRIRAKNVIDTGYETKEIVSALRKALSPKFKASLKNLPNPYGDGRAAERILDTLSRIPLEKLCRKKFFEPRE